MRQTYSTLKAKFLRNIQSVGVSDTNLDSEFDYQLGVTYQLMLAKLRNYKTYMTSSFSTVAGTQYYSNPPGYVSSDGIVITVGSVNYPLKLISSEFLWEQLNAVLLQASALPQFYFPRRDDFGIWPIPQAAYTGNIYYHYRDRNLSVADYIGATMNVTSGSPTITGFSNAFTPAMVGRWFTVTDQTAPGQGYFYRISAYVDTNTLTLAQNYTGSTKFVTGYRIGESPELPEDGHMFLVDGVTAGYYKDIRKDMTNYTLFNNSFWTGDPQTSMNKVEADQVKSGLLGLMNAYADREDERIIQRKPGLNPLQWKSWSSTLALA